MWRFVRSGVHALGRPTRRLLPWLDLGRDRRGLGLLGRAGAHRGLRWKADRLRRRSQRALGQAGQAGQVVWMSPFHLDRTQRPGDLKIEFGGGVSALTSIILTLATCSSHMSALVLS